MFQCFPSGVKGFAVYHPGAAQTQTFDNLDRVLTRTYPDPDSGVERFGYSARGLVNYSAAETRRIMRRPSAEIESILGYMDEPELIHRDNLVVL